MSPDGLKILFATEHILVWGWAISFPRGPRGAVTCADKGLMCLNVAVLLTFIQRKACI